MIETVQAITPEIVLVAVASAMYLAATFLRRTARFWFWTAIAALALAALSLAVCASRAELQSAVVVMDRLALFAGVLALLTGLALICLSDGATGDGTAPEYFASVLLVVAGGMFVASANELVLLFLGLELISIPTYLLLYLPRQDAAAQESAAKYFFLSIFSSALFLYGLSFVYGAVGSTNLEVLAEGDQRLSTSGTLLVALVLILAGLGFKVAAVPFHFYAPDVYQGTTTTLAALLAWMPKAAGIVAMLRLVPIGMPYLGAESSWILWVLAAATMTMGNLMGLLQQNLRRLFAYSSIAHAGYMLIGVGVACTHNVPYLTQDWWQLPNGAEGVVFYLLAYAAMTLGAFAVLVYLGTPPWRAENVEDLAGLGRTNPGLALAMALFLFSLTGIPITAGFWAKLVVFSSAVASGDQRYIWLAVIGVVNAAISSYYYLRIIGVMYMRESDARAVPARGRRPALCVVAVCAAVTLVVGLLPGPFLTWASSGSEPTLAAREEPRITRIITDVNSGPEPLINAYGR